MARPNMSKQIPIYIYIYNKVERIIERSKLDEKTILLL